MLGKTRRAEMRAVIDDYVKRIGRQSPIEVTEVRDGDAAIKKLDADRAATAVLLDAAREKFRIPRPLRSGLANFATAERARLFSFAATRTVSPPHFANAFHKKSLSAP